MIFGAALALIIRESVEIDRLGRAPASTPATLLPLPSAFSRYAIYAFIALFEVFALFTVSLSVEQRVRREGTIPNGDNSTFGVRRSAFGVRRSAFGVRRSAFGVRRSAFGVRRSAFGVRRHPDCPTGLSRAVDSSARPTSVVSGFSRTVESVKILLTQ